MRTLAEQLIDTLLVLFGVSTLVFLLLVLVPGDPVDVVLGESAQPADRAAMRASLGLDRPLGERWLDFYADLASGDLGSSLVRRQPVADLIVQRLPATLQLAAAAFVIVVSIALPLGTLAARHRGRWPDRLAQTLALFGLSIPNFWLGPLLVLLFSVQLGWTPVSGPTFWPRRKTFGSRTGASPAPPRTSRTGGWKSRVPWTAKWSSTRSTPAPRCSWRISRIP